ncbi:YlqD family protein [Alkalihalobacillus sp. CinArs1]|uniref:YlqD family protein n=1 Tax=Alkalihalobacillus sp. CinArs1 TaxID=2995314 RepID=UPI0022DE632F|nr:YlqD family protein [Alkalihalobacillus sp. CinArs1]
MNIIKKYEVKQLLTESSRAFYIDKWDQEIAILDQEREQLQFEKKRLQKKRPSDKEWISEQFEKELHSRNEQISILEYKIEQIEQLPPESELHEGEVDAIQSIEVGDEWKAAEQKGKIIIKDGIVQSITP